MNCESKRDESIWYEKNENEIWRKATPAGLEPTRDKPNRFLVDRLNRSATVSYRQEEKLQFKYNVLGRRQKFYFHNSICCRTTTF